MCDRVVNGEMNNIKKENEIKDSWICIGFTSKKAYLELIMDGCSCDCSTRGDWITTINNL